MTPTMTSPVARVAEVLPAYANMIHLVERLHRRLMDVVTDALDRANFKDVNAVQAITPSRGLIAGPCALALASVVKKYMRSWRGPMRSTPRPLSNSGASSPVILTL